MPHEEEWIALLAACDRALETGADPGVSSGAGLSAEWQARLGRSLSCIRLLRRALTDDPAPAPGVAAPSPAASAWASVYEVPFTRLGPFRICCELSRDRHGTTFLAYDPRLGREVTVRVLHPEALAGGQRRQRFLEAARAAAGLEHANLVTVHEAGEDGPVCYVASAYCPGITLEAWLAERDEPVPARLAAEVAYALAAAVQHAHSRGVVHGDLGPGHVLLELPDPRWPAEAAGAGGLGYVPRVKDFGLAWALADGGEGRAVLPSPGPAVAGQAGGRSGEGPEAADLRALGAILHELLTGRPPSGAEAVRLGLSGQVGAGEAPAAQGVRHEVPRALQAICLRCLHNGPRPHYLSAQESADELQRFLGGAAG